MSVKNPGNIREISSKTDGFSVAAAWRDVNVMMMVVVAVVAQLCPKSIRHVSPYFPVNREVASLLRTY